MEIKLERIEHILAEIKQQRVAIIGDCMLDEYLWGVVERISPEAPVPVVDLKKQSLRLGGSANVAWNISALNAKPLLMGVVGNDATGRKFIQELEEFNISSEYSIKSDTRPTTLKTRVVAHSQQVVRVDKEDRSDVVGVDFEKLVSTLEKNLEQLDAVIISDYGKGVITKALLERVVGLCHQNNIITAVDPKEKHFDYYKGVSVITPNRPETEKAVGRKVDSDEELKDAGWEMARELELGALLITRGKEGMSLFAQDDEYFYLPTVAQDVYDVTGAGDTVVAVFTLALAAGASNQEAAYLANHAAGIVVGKFGTGTVTKDELIENIKELDFNGK